MKRSYGALGRKMVSCARAPSAIGHNDVGTCDFDDFSEPNVPGAGATSASEAADPAIMEALPVFSQLHQIIERVPSGVGPVLEAMDRLKVALNQAVKLAKQTEQERRRREKQALHMREIRAKERALSLVHKEAAQATETNALASALVGMQPAFPAQVSSESRQLLPVVKECSVLRGPLSMRRGIVAHDGNIGEPPFRTMAACILEDLRIASGMKGNVKVLFLSNRNKPPADDEFGFHDIGMNPSIVQEKGAQIHLQAPTLVIEEGSKFRFADFIWQGILHLRRHAGTGRAKYYADLGAKALLKDSCIAVWALYCKGSKCGEWSVSYVLPSAWYEMARRGMDMPPSFRDLFDSGNTDEQVELLQYCAYWGTRLGSGDHCRLLCLLGGH